MDETVILASDLAVRVGFLPVAVRVQARALPPSLLLTAGGMKARDFGMLLYLSTC